MREARGELCKEKVIKPIRHHVAQCSGPEAARQVRFITGPDGYIAPGQPDALVADAFGTAKRNNTQLAAITIKRHKLPVNAIDVCAQRLINKRSLR